MNTPFRPPKLPPFKLPVEKLENKVSFDKFVKVIISEYSSRIERKTGWGKNEVMIEFYEAVIAAISKMLEEVRRNSHE